MSNNMFYWFKTKFPIIVALLRALKFKYYNYIGKNNPIKLASILYNKAHPGYTLDILNPSNFDEKINWLKFNSDTSLWSEYADKYKVRDFVKSRGLYHTLNTIYGIYEKADDIEWDCLPSKFVVKSTNGASGVQIMIVQNKSNINKKKAGKIFNSWLSYTSPLFLAEPHYLKIKPRILIEKYLEDGKNSSSLVDYKFNCFNGKVYSIFFCSDREENSVKYSVYDLNWNLYPQKITPKYRTTKVFSKPKSLQKMIEYSSILSKGFPFVRVDWYEINGEPVFSELTFTPGGGYQQFYTMEYLKELGEKLQLPKK